MREEVHIAFNDLDKAYSKIKVLGDTRMLHIYSLMLTIVQEMYRDNVTCLSSLIYTRKWSYESRNEAVVIWEFV